MSSKAHAPPSTTAISFMRGEKSSASVRLRNKKAEKEAGGGCKKRSRHSGDFSFFSHKSSFLLNNNNNSPIMSEGKNGPDDSGVEVVEGGGDWAYITFPNGVPIVQDIKTNAGPVGNTGISGVSKPVKVITHDIPGVQLPFKQEVTAPSASSSNHAGTTGPLIPSLGGHYDNITSPQTNNTQVAEDNNNMLDMMSSPTYGPARPQPPAYHLSASQYVKSPTRAQSPFRNVMIQPKAASPLVVMRNRQFDCGRAAVTNNNNFRNSRIVDEQITGAHLRYGTRQHQPYVTKVDVFQGEPHLPLGINAAPAALQNRPNVLFRRRSDQPNSIAMIGSASKRCSGEFEFTNNIRKSGDFSRVIFDSVSNPCTPGDVTTYTPPGVLQSMVVSHGGAGSSVRVQVNTPAPVLCSPASEGAGGVIGTSTTGSKSSRSSSSRSGSTPPFQQHQSKSTTTPTTDSKASSSPQSTVVNSRMRQVGLGRRSVTQIHIQQKKNSYNLAVCKSQENLVKASLAAGDSNSKSSSRKNEGEMTSKAVLDDDDDDEEEENSSDATTTRRTPTVELLERSNSSTLKKGLLWQQRDKLFSQWKERYFILTSDYLQCFKKGTSSNRITEMGEFIFKIKLNEVEEVDLIDKRGYLVVSVTPSGRDGKIYLRKTEGIREWYTSLKDCVRESKKRRTERTGGGVGPGGLWKTKQLTDSSSIENWLRARKKIGLQYAYLDTSTAKDDADKTGTSRSNDGTSTIRIVSGSSSSDSSGLLVASAKSARSQITLDELSDLYRHEEEEDMEREAAAKNRLLSNCEFLSNGNSAAPEQSNNKPVCNNVRSNNKKKINRLSLVSSDFELPDYVRGRGGPGAVEDLSMEFEKSIFLRSKKNAITGATATDNESNDSGNNSMNTNGSVGSSNSSHSNPRHKEERLETHMESEFPDDNPDEGTLSVHPKKKLDDKKSSSQSSSPTSGKVEAATNLAHGVKSDRSSCHLRHSRSSHLISSTAASPSHRNNPFIQNKRSPSVNSIPNNNNNNNDVMQQNRRRQQQYRNQFQDPQQEPEIRRTHMPLGLQVTHV